MCIYSLTDYSPITRPRHPNLNAYLFFVTDIGNMHKITFNYVPHDQLKLPPRDFLAGTFNYSDLDPESLTPSHSEARSKLRVTMDSMPLKKDKLKWLNKDISLRLARFAPKRPRRLINCGIPGHKFFKHGFVTGSSTYSTGRIGYYQIQVSYFKVTYEYILTKYFIRYSVLTRNVRCEFIATLPPSRFLLGSC